MKSERTENIYQLKSQTEFRIYGRSNSPSSTSSADNNS